MPTLPHEPRALALEITRRVSRGAFSSVELDRALNAARLEGRDSALVTDLVYGSLRHRIWLDAALAARLRDPAGLPEEVREGLRLGAYEKLVRGTPEHAAVSEWVDVVRSSHPSLAGLVNAVLRRVRSPANPSAATERSLPAWLWERFEASLGDAADTAVAGMREPAPLWLTAYDEGAADALRGEGCEVEPGPIEATLRVRPSMSLARLAAYRDGRVQPQNPTSTWVARSLGARPGERVVDLCSGAGIKAALFASAGARVEAFDASESKLERGRANLSRLGLRVEARRHDLRTVPPATEPAPKVILDAPCSGTGTLRGHPEIPLRLNAADVATLASLQDELLDTAAALTAPGGTLTYAVCSLTSEEGPERIEAFLARHPDFVPAPLDAPLPHRSAGGGLFVLPTGGLDGFFAARLGRRIGAAAP